MTQPQHPPPPDDNEPNDTTRPPSEEDIRRGLRQAGCEEGQVRRKAPKRDILILLAYAGGIVVLGIGLYLLGYGLFDFGTRAEALIVRLDRGLIITLAILAIAKAIRTFVVDRMGDDVSRYNVRRIMRLIVSLLLAFVAISVIFRNWYAAVVSLGLISLVLSFALQTPITSFIGWLYILVREPYRVGDRIQIGDATGDVIDLSYFDTTLWEFGGPYLSTDHPSGRIIKFPNANVLSQAVYNYSWPLFPYIWNEVTFQIAYGADLDFVARVMKEAVLEELGSEMSQRIGTYRDLLAHTPVDQLQVREEPVVLFKVSENTWVEAFVRYLVDPKRAGTVRSRLTARMLNRLNAEPEKVMFPKGDNR